MAKGMVSAMAKGMVRAMEKDILKHTGFHMEDMVVMAKDTTYKLDTVDLIRGTVDSTRDMGMGHTKA